MPESISLITFWRVLAFGLFFNPFKCGKRSVFTNSKNLPLCKSISSFLFYPRERPSPASGKDIQKKAENLLILPLPILLLWFQVHRGYAKTKSTSVPAHIVKRLRNLTAALYCRYFLQKN